MAKLIVDSSESMRGVVAQHSWYTKIISFVEEILVSRKKIDFTIIIVGDAAIKKLHSVYLKRPKVTDVLSFCYPAEGNEKRDQGELFISFPQTRRQAKKYKTSLSQEMARLVIHGALHVYGYDHKTPKERKAMFSLAKNIFDYAKRRGVVC
ncbi:rRNA maturation RNase YbeY [Candidatus Uhrbacteria bacterium]|nr:rRNA maturation RNase YbeY [Candidatus Uhrbacteria bacterium]